MLPKWTGDVVGTLHVNSIEIRELAAKMGCAPEYLGKILNGIVGVKCFIYEIAHGISKLFRTNFMVTIQTVTSVKVQIDVIY